MHVPPVGQSRHEWDILQEIGRHFDMDAAGTTSETVFHAMSTAVPAFAGMTYQKIGKRGALLSREPEAEMVV